MSYRRKNRRISNSSDIVIHSVHKVTFKSITVYSSLICQLLVMRGCVAYVACEIIMNDLCTKQIGG